VRVLIAGGGTGGHLYPGIALARELQRRDPSTVVTFVGTSAGIESRVVPHEGFPLDLVRVAGLKGKGLMDRAHGALLLPLAALDGWQVLSIRRPSIVVGVGGFASGPVVALAWLRRIPTLLLEQNALPGVTNRLLAPLVDAAAVNFEEALRFFPRTGFVAGNPVRSEFFVPDEEEANDQSASSQPQSAARVLIVGGSHAINVSMVEAAPRLAATGLELAITHQTGPRDMDRVRDAYERAGIAARVEAFIYEMHREVRQADLVVARAGATTLSELAAAGRAAILVPLPTAADDHQRKNAEAFARAGGAVVIEQRVLTGERIAAEIAALVKDRARVREMGRAARALARPDAAARIADKVVALAR